MILNGCSLNAGSAGLSYKTRNPKSSASAGISRFPKKDVIACSRSFWGPHQNLISCVPKGTQFSCLSSASSLFLGGELGSLAHAIPKLTTRRRLALTPRASKDIPFSFRYPPMTKRPRWWWRTLACLSYLLPLHQTWMYAKTAYHLHHFLEDLEHLSMPFLRALGRLPKWSLIAYFAVGYLGVVRRKEWPHFFRFHVVTGMLLEIALQVTGIVSRRCLPQSIYWGKIGMHFWTFFGFAFLFTVLECIRCALAGMYADIPFCCDAAFIQMPYD